MARWHGGHSGMTASVVYGGMRVGGSGPRPPTIWPGGTVVQGELLRQLPEKVNHFDRRQGGVEALVAGLGAGAVEGLLDGVASENAEDDRDASGQGCPRYAGCRFAGHVFVMVRSTANDAAQAD